MSIKDRIKQIMEREQLNAGAFAERIGVAQATVSHILGERNKYPSTDVILRLHNSYPDIDLTWLMTGEGTMSRQPDDAPENADSAYPLFAENRVNPTNGQAFPENRKEMPLEMGEMAPKEIVRQEVIYKEKPSKKITEIRIFFDDNTYEIFKPES